jgi:hypothetical protein
MFGPKRNEETGGWRKSHSEELLFCSLHQILMIKSRRLRRAGHVPRIGEMRNKHKTLVGETEGKIPLGKTLHRW